MSGRVVVDTSPLIGLQRIGRLDLLKERFGEVIVPSAVLLEFARRGSPPPWLVERRPTGDPDPRVSGAVLGSGEREAIALALQLGVERLVLDEEAGRRLAVTLELPVIGTLGLLLLAKQQGLIAAARPLVESLVAVNFRLAPHLVASVLAEAEEADVDP